MDWRWPTLAGGLAAAAGAAAGVWLVRPDPIAAASAGVAIAALGGVAFEMAARRRQIAALQRELVEIKAAQATVAIEVSQAKDGMIAVHHALQAGGGAQKQRISAMEDEVAVLQNLVERLQDAATASSGGLGRQARIERRTAAGMTEAQVLDLVRAAVADGAVDLYLQPVVTLPQRRRRYYECFSRIPDQRGDLLAADTYMAAAEAAGLLAPIDNLLLFRAVQLVRRARSQNAHVGFFCNVSGHTLRDSGFMNDFLSFLEDNPELAPSLILEIAQPDWAPEDIAIKRHMESLVGLGARFSMDHVEDFELDGMLLRRRGFRFVKIAAGPLLAESGPDAHRLKRSLALDDIQLIVEKIERERDLVELLEHDIELGQGYLFGEPRAPASSVEAA